MLFKFLTFFLLISCFITAPLFSQSDYIYSKEGTTVLNRRELINNCLKSLNTDRSNNSALSICECQINKLNLYFTKKQYRSVTANHTIDISKLIESDSVMNKRFQLCYTSSNQTVLLSAQGFGKQMIDRCKENIISKAAGSVNSKKVESFCSCQLQIIKNQKITDTEMEAINDPNSILFYQVMSTCGDPYTDNNDNQTEWAASSQSDIVGPSKDTVRLLSFNGMHYVKLKVGSVVYFWLLDTGASDMLITKELEEKLISENVLSKSNYLGTGQYEMANGILDTCRKYKIQNIKIGHSSINNLVIAVSDKARRVIASKSLLNKFTNWMINNKQNILILDK